MTDQESQTADTIATKTDRLETIIARLEEGDISLKQAHQLHEEGQALLEELEEELDIGDSEIVERP